MIWNPLSTLAGRLILVTIVAVAVSHILAFALFANERGASMRRQAETNLIERIVLVRQRLGGLDPGAQAALAEAASDLSLRFAVLEAPSVRGVGVGAARRVANSVSDQLDDAEVRAQSRLIEIQWPVRMRLLHHHNDNEPGDGDGRMPSEGIDIRVEPAPDDAPPTPQMVAERQRKVTQLNLNVALEDGRWLHALAYLPAPRPVPTHIWVAAIVSLLVVGVGAALVARQIGKPLADLANAAERLGMGDLSASAPVSGPNDVRRASTAFNAMAERLGRQMSRQRHMLWALSHDLRTPITALTLRAELVEDETLRQRLLGPLHEMETLTEQALSLARAGASEEARVRVDLAEIARTLCGELQELGFAVRAQADAQVMVECRPSEIARALRNLAENAAKYGGGGVMRIYQDEAGAVVAEVLDDGPGLPADLLARVTEPFFRADPSRAQDGGAGLGLAIVQAIADSHGGRLVLENRSPRGLSAKIILPR